MAQTERESKKQTREERERERKRKVFYHEPRGASCISLLLSAHIHTLSLHSCFLVCVFFPSDFLSPVISSPPMCVLQLLYHHHGRLPLNTNMSQQVTFDIYQFSCSSTLFFSLAFDILFSSLFVFLVFKTRKPSPFFSAV